MKVHSVVRSRSSVGARTRGLASGLALMVAVWAPARAFAWIPQSIPAGDFASAFSGGSGDTNWNLPLLGIDAQLDGAVQALSFSQPQSVLGSGHTDWVSMGNFAVSTNSTQLFGLNWMYWAGMAAIAGVGLMALGGNGGGGGSNHTDGSSPDQTGHAAPVPEPSSLLMFGLGGLALLLASRRRLIGAGAREARD